MFLSEKELILEKTLGKILQKFPGLFDNRLLKGWYKLIGNTTHQFIANRSHAHLRRLLFTQFFLQKKIETTLKQTLSERALFLKIFIDSSHRLCVALTVSFFKEQESISCQHIFKAFCSLLPSIQKIPNSFYSWTHPKLPYFFCYLEVQKLRGKNLSFDERRDIEKSLKHRLAHSIASLAPGVFYPYNEEESYRQLLLLQKEMHHIKKLPNASIYFREQTSSMLEFLVHLVHASEPLEKAIKQLPTTVYFFPHLHREAIPYQWEVFSLTIPSHYFYENGAINLLCARRHVVKYIQQLVGPFRDYNGGLFEKQQEQFETLKMHFAATIPHFHLFAEKVFYALRPIEKRLSLSQDEAQKLFVAISKAINGNYKILRLPKGILVVKTANPITLSPLINKIKEWEEEEVAYAKISHSDFHYLCVLDRKNIYLPQLEALFEQPTQPYQEHTILRLTFQPGEPPSINPHCAFGDLRCRALSKLLFEGLTRIDTHGIPQLASAEKMTCSKDKLTYTFKLRSHHWSNGEKVTAFHFVSSWCSILQNPHFTSCSELLFMIKNAQKFKKGCCSIEKVGFHAHDTETLEIQLEWPDPTFLYKLAQPVFFPIFSITQEPEWFNGPYLIQKKNSQGMLLESNPYYWDHHHIFFKLVQIEWLADIEKLYALFQKRKIDWIGNPYCRLTSEMISHLQEKKELQKQPVARALWVYINTQHPFLASAKIRRALSLSIDRSRIAEHIYPGNAPLYQPLPLFLSLCPNILVDNNLSQAKQLFEAGFKEIKVAREALPSMTLCYPHIAGFKSLAEYLKETWEKAFGVQIQLEGTEWNIFRNHLEKGEFQMGMCGESALYPDPSELLERFASLKIANFSQWEHPIYQEKLNLAKALPNKRTQFLREAEMLLCKQMPFIPLCNFNALYAHHPKLKGYALDHSGCVDFRWAYLEDSI